MGTKQLITHEELKKLKAENLVLRRKAGALQAFKEDLDHERQYDHWVRCDGQSALRKAAGWLKSFEDAYDKGLADDKLKDDDIKIKKEE